MATQKITDDSFATDVLGASKTVIVDFWAEWCGPCKALGPVLGEVADEMAATVTIGKMNVDDNPHTPGKFNIRGIPTLIAFKDGKPVATKVGSLSKSQLVDWIKSVG